MTDIRGQYLATPVTTAEINDELPIQVDNQGRIKISPVSPGPQLAEGTYNATLPTIVDGDAGSLEVDVNGRLITLNEGQHLTSLPTLADGDKGPIQLDASGRLIVVADAATTSVTSEGQYNTTLPTLSNTNKSPIQLDANARVLTLPYGQYVATPPTLVDGDKTPLNVNSEGDAKVAEQFAAIAEDNINGVLAVTVKPLPTSTYAPSVYTNYESAASANIKATPGGVFSVYCENLNGAVRYIGIYDKATAAATNDVPVVSYRVPASGATMIGTDLLTVAGIYCSTGITFGVSTDPTKYAAATAGEHNTVVVYK